MVLAFDHDDLHRRMARLGWTLVSHDESGPVTSDTVQKGAVVFVLIFTIHDSQEEAVEHASLAATSGTFDGLVLRHGSAVLVGQVDFAADLGAARDLVVGLTGVQPTLVRQANPGTPPP
jgi:hypothetical protein